MAFQTRKVNIKQLHDSKYIAAMVYTAGIALVIIIVTLFIGASFINVVEVLYSGSLLAATTVFLALAFIPIVSLLHREIVHTFTVRVYSFALTKKNYFSDGQLAPRSNWRVHNDRGNELRGWK